MDEWLSRCDTFLKPFWKVKCNTRPSWCGQFQAGKPTGRRENQLKSSPVAGKILRDTERRRKTWHGRYTALQGSSHLLWVNNPATPSLFFPCRLQSESLDPCLSVLLLGAGRGRSQFTSFTLNALHCLGSQMAMAGTQNCERAHTHTQPGDQPEMSPGCS